MVDVGRAAFDADMRLHRDDPGRITPVRWYRVPWDRPALGVPTFASLSIWDDGIRLPPLGEVAASRRWWAGFPAPFVPPGKPGRCGSAPQWRDGVLTTDPLPFIDVLTGVPLCCNPQPPAFDPGIVEGADFFTPPDSRLTLGLLPWSVWTPVVFTDCCEEPTPFTIYATVEATGSFSEFDGLVFPMVFDPTGWPGSPVAWTGIIREGSPPFVYQVACGGAGAWIGRMGVTVFTSPSLCGGLGCGPPLDLFNMWLVGHPDGSIRFNVSSVPPPQRWSSLLPLGWQPSSTWTFPPAWSSTLPLGLAPSSTWTTPPAWSSTLPLGLAPSSTWFVPAWSSELPLGLEPSAVWSTGGGPPPPPPPPPPPGP